MQVSRLWDGLMGVAMSCAIVAGSGCAEAPSTPVLVHLPKVADLCPAPDALLRASDSEYGRELIRKISHRAFYPDISQRLAESGVVQLCVQMSRQGDIQKALIDTGSGYPLLDGAALFAVGRAHAAGGFDSVPEQLGGEEGNVWFAVPVSFKLEGEAQAAALAGATIASDADCHGAANSVGDWSGSPEFRRYAQQITKKFQDQMLYPKDAVTQREEGTAVICMQMGRDGNIQKARIWRSAGDPLFDGMLLLAVGVVNLRQEIGPVPDVVPQRLDEITFEMPVAWEFR